MIVVALVDDYVRGIEQHHEVSKNVDSGIGSKDRDERLSALQSIAADVDAPPAGLGLRCDRANSYDRPSGSIDFSGEGDGCRTREIHRETAISSIDRETTGRNVIERRIVQGLCPGLGQSCGGQENYDANNDSGPIHDGFPPLSIPGRGKTAR